jgi:hypothetical protein
VSFCFDTSVQFLIKWRQSGYKCYKWLSAVFSDVLRSVHSVYNEISHDVNQQENVETRPCKDTTEQTREEIKKRRCLGMRIRKVNWCFCVWRRNGRRNKRFRLQYLSILSSLQKEKHYQVIVFQTKSCFKTNNSSLLYSTFRLLALFKNTTCIPSNTTLFVTNSITFLCARRH